MTNADHISIEPCARNGEIAQFLDGELNAPEEVGFEKHVADCRICARKLNEQKRLLLTLNRAFERENQFELPADFFKTVIVRAESNVSGLRRRDELARSLLIVCGLFFGGVVIGVAGKRSNFLSAALGDSWALVRVVAGALSVFCYDLGLLIVIALRVACNYLTGSSPVSTVFFVLLLVVSLAALSSLLFNYRSRETQK